MDELVHDLPDALSQALPSLTFEHALRRDPAGDVWLVRHDSERCVLKWGARGSVRREYENCRRVEHPAVVQAHDFYESKEHGAILMEYVRGRAFPGFERERIPTGALRRNLPQAFGYDLQEEGRSQFSACSAAQAEQLRQLVRVIAGGLDAIHASGLLHLDIAPDNVWVDGKEAVILDLEIAIERDAPLSASACVGSVAYLAPEVATKPCPASDTYSLGVMLFEALTGSLPFGGGGPEVLVRKQSLSAPRAAELAVGVPADLDELCAALLSRAPHNRPSLAELSR